MMSACKPIHYVVIWKLIIFLKLKNTPTDQTHLSKVIHFEITKLTYWFDDKPNDILTCNFDNNVFIVMLVSM